MVYVLINDRSHELASDTQALGIAFQMVVRVFKIHKHNCHRHSICVCVIQCVKLL